jgi:hypothetical protein
LKYKILEELIREDGFKEVYFVDENDNIYAVLYFFRMWKKLNKINWPPASFTGPLENIP